MSSAAFIEALLTPEVLDAWQEALNRSRRAIFEAAQEQQGQEHSHLEYLLHRDFTDVVDVSIDRTCSSLGVSTTRMYETLRDDKGDPVVDALLQIITMTTQFDLFAEMMRDAQKQNYLFTVLKSWMSTLGLAKK